MTDLARELRKLQVRTTNWGRLVAQTSVTAAPPEPAVAATTTPPRLIYDHAA